MKRNPTWGRYAVYITWLHTHFPSQGHVVFSYLKNSINNGFIHSRIWLVNTSCIMCRTTILHNLVPLVKSVHLLRLKVFHEKKQRCTNLVVVVSYITSLVLGMNEQFVMDLVDLQKLAKWNKGYKYLLTVIDVLSKYAWVEPLKSKSAAQLVAALERLRKRTSPRRWK